MERNNVKQLESLPVGRLGIIAMDSFAQTEKRSTNIW